MREVVPNVVRLDDGRFATRNLVPGVRVYGEDLVRVDGVEYRMWNPSRSKLAAALVKGLKDLGLDRSVHVLYLGAGQGTTASHVSDAVPDGRVVAVEFSARAFRKLLEVAEARPNLVPILADATEPDTFRHFVARADVVFQDVAQRDQAGIFLKNARAFGAARGLLTVKARSVDVAKDVPQVVDEISTRIEAAGHRLLERLDLAPFEKDHALLSVAFRHAEREGSRT